MLVPIMGNVEPQVQFGGIAGELQRSGSGGI